MNLKSMTGFGRAEYLDSNYSISVEVKSVNNRYKDFRFKMSSSLMMYENDFKKIIGDRLKRGSVDVAIFYKKTADLDLVSDIDLEKVKVFLHKFKDLLESEEVPFTVRPTDFLRSEFLQTRLVQTENDELVKHIKKTLLQALDKLEASRLEEGKKTLEVLREHRDTYEKCFREIPKYASGFKEQVEKRLQDKFTELKERLPVDQPRFMQEVIYYLEKMDIQEEMNRVIFHLQKFDKILETEQEKGRELEFLAQELGRETNTLGSKSNMKEISELVIQMKVQLEKIREQSLNVE
jgi:uncharacterized protein (TIGR00255 family)